MFKSSYIFFFTNKAAASFQQVLLSVTLLRPPSRLQWCTLNKYSVILFFLSLPFFCIRPYLPQAGVCSIFLKVCKHLQSSFSDNIASRGQLHYITESGVWCGFLLPTQEYLCACNCLRDILYHIMLHLRPNSTVGHWLGKIMEYVSVCSCRMNIVTHCCWLRNILHEFLLLRQEYIPFISRHIILFTNGESGDMAQCS